MKSLHPSLAPSSVEELSRIVARCDRGGEKIRVEGANTLHAMGFPLERTDVTLSTSALTGIIANERDDLTLAVHSGTPLQNVTALLAAHGQFIPFDAPHPQHATVGGTLGAGWLGPRRHVFGRLRDYVIGSAVVLADGTVARAGGMVVKNVAGYDMSRMYIGSFGTLGIIVRSNFKTVALPKRSRIFLAPLPERTRTRACAALASLPIPPSAAFWIDGFHHAIDGDEGPEGRIVVLLEGSDALLERATRDVRSALGRAGVPETNLRDAGAREAFQRVVDAYIAPLGERSITYRLRCLAGAVIDRALRAAAIAQHHDLRTETIADVMNGDVVVRVSDLNSRAFGAKIQPFDDALHEAEPRAQVIAGDHPRRSDLRVWGVAPPALDKMNALKMRFDPNRTLNPGRFIDGI